jgi:hypothetical protein
VASTPRLRRIVPLRTVALESPADVQAFHSALAKRFSLPRIRIALRLGTLNESRCMQHEQQLNRLLATRGGAGAALGALLLLGLTLAYPLSPAGDESASAIAAWFAQGLLGALLGGRGGQLAGLGLARQRLRALCRRIEAELGAASSAQG